MDFKLPELGEGVYEAELVAWLVKPGETVKRGQNLMEVLTDKATMEVPSPFAGKIGTLLAQPGQQVKVGDVVLSYQGSGRSEDKEHTPPPKTEKQARRAPATSDGAAGNKRNGASIPKVEPVLSVKAAPSVRFMARKLGVDLGKIHGSGPGGRILIGDLSTVLTASRAPGARLDAAEESRDYGRPGTRHKFQGLRRKISEHMVRSKRTIPHYTYVDEVDVTQLAELRENLRAAFAEAGVKLTYLAFFVRAVVRALKEVPLVNATLDEASGEIVLHDHYHIGIAVATPNGLIVPVIRDADRKDLTEVAREVERLSVEARAGKTRLEDLGGGTFSITSIGNIGGLFSTPIINHPEVGILGVGRIVRRPVYDTAGNIRAADLVYLSLSFDHRVIDGDVGAAYGNALARQLKNPARLVLPDQLG
jgi:pyruvate dehydrogenase E2 component (dihydrolipoamide acetyltransferase)/2-oxoisovalerate dehydrogenase E2 component (dihydrolipoyl transacylase)